MSSGKKIAILGPANPYRGGIAAFNENLALHLLDAGHEVEMINFKFQYPDWIYPGKNQYTEAAPPEQLIIHRKIHSLNPFNWWKVRTYLSKAGFEVIFCPFWLPALSPCFSSILKGVKNKVRIIGLLHNIVPHESRKGDRILTSLFLSRLTEGIVLSDSVRRDLMAFPESKKLKIHHLFHPVYDHFGERVEKAFAARELGLDPENRYLLFFGLVRKYKGLDLLISAFSKASLPEDVRLVIAGEFYDDKSEYLDLIRNRGVEERVHLFDEYIPDNKVKYFFSLSEMVVLPYRSATQSGVSQIAIHFATPVVSTNVGGIGEYIKDGINGKLIPPTEEKLIQVLEVSLHDQEVAHWREGQERMKEKLSWHNFVQALALRT